MDQDSQQPVIRIFGARRLALWSGILVMLAGAVIAAVAQAQERPNIVLILADDLGWSDVGFMGAQFYETPHIDRLAAEGLVFRAAYTAGPNCAPTRASLISGMYTPRHHIYTPGAASKGDIRRMRLLTPVRDSLLSPQSVKEHDEPFLSRLTLDPEVVSIAEVLKSAGYVTARFGKWHVGPDKQGFDFSSSDGTPCAEKSHYGSTTVADRLTAAGLDFIDEHRDRPFFLYLSHWDVHTPLRAKADVVSKYERKLASFDAAEKDYLPVYAAMIEAVDRSVGRIMARLVELGLDENTLVIFSSDNGGLARATHNAPLRAGKGSLYEGGIRVPFAARWPAVIRAGGSTDEPVTSVDLLPTLVELSGSDLPQSQPVDGVSFAPLLGGASVLAREAIFWHFPLYLNGEGRENFLPYPGEERLQGNGWRMKPGGAIRKGKWKLVEFFDERRVELYDLDQDIGETKDLSNAFPDKARELHEELKEWRTATKAPVPSQPNPQFTSRGGPPGVRR